MRIPVVNTHTEPCNDNEIPELKSFSYEFLKNLGIVTEHNRPIDSGSYSYWPDFTFIIDGKRVYLEHMGKLDDPQYHRKAGRKDQKLQNS